ncbi:unnamed protein product [Prorocentrum cordatum]|uniref:FACT complex subunit n=1 Tax=Prorocentrum cordatum TaxID=2364126 RepID=A0ABN9URC0_9DINO|nr:unnamed protein product [Polarella glacialis]
MVTLCKDQRLAELRGQLPRPLPPKCPSKELAEESVAGSVRALVWVSAAARGRRHHCGIRIPLFIHASTRENHDPVNVQKKETITIVMNASVHLIDEVLSCSAITTPQP